MEKNKRYENEHFVTTRPFENGVIMFQIWSIQSPQLPTDIWLRHNITIISVLLSIHLENCVLLIVITKISLKYNLWLIKWTSHIAIATVHAFMRFVSYLLFELASSQLFVTTLFRSFLSRIRFKILKLFKL